MIGRGLIKGPSPGRFGGYVARSSGAARDIAASILFGAAEERTGTAALVEAPDTVEATATLAIAATATLTEADDTVVGTSVSTLSATAGLIEADDVVAATATLAIAATMAATEAPDTLSATATLANSAITATASLTEAPDTLTAAASLAVTASAALSEQDDTLAATAALAIAGSAALIEQDDTAAGGAALALTATTTATEADDTLAALGSLAITATASLIEAPDTMAATAVLAIVATSTVTEEPDALEASASISNAYISAVADLIEAADTLAAAAVITITASAGLVEADDTITASGEMTLYGGPHMSTARDIVTRALRRATVLDAVETPTAHDAAEALSALNAMMFSWRSRHVDVLHQNFTLDSPVIYFVPSLITAAETISVITNKGLWIASTNSPQLVSGTGTRGDTYKVAIAGSTVLDGVTSWAVGDFATFDGRAWLKSQNVDAFEQALIALLSMRLCSDYGLQIPPHVALEAREGWRNLEAQFVKSPDARLDGPLTRMPSNRYTSTI